MFYRGPKKCSNADGLDSLPVAMDVVTIKLVMNIEDLGVLYLKNGVTRNFF